MGGVKLYRWMQLAFIPTGLGHSAQGCRLGDYPGQVISRFLLAELKTMCTNGAQPRPKQTAVGCGVFRPRESAAGTQRGWLGR